MTNPPDPTEYARSPSGLYRVTHVNGCRILTPVPLENHAAYSVKIDSRTTQLWADIPTDPPPSPDE